jgi:hypothetical protein
MAEKGQERLRSTMPVRSQAEGEICRAALRADP